MGYDGWRRRRTTARLGGTWFHAVVSPAEPLVQAMGCQTSFADAALAAVCALKADPGCIEAHIFLAGHCREADDERAHLAKAVETGDFLWSSVADKQGGFAWWGVPATRPYMQAIKRLADWHAENGMPEDAERGYRRLLRMNPADNQGIRFILAEQDEPAPAF